MKRDWNLLRWLLNQAQSCQGGYPIVITNGAMYGGKHYSLDIGDLNFEEVCEHALLLQQFSSKCTTKIIHRMRCSICFACGGFDPNLL